MPLGGWKRGRALGGEGRPLVDWCCDRRGKPTGSSRSQRDEPPHYRMVGLVDVGDLLSADGVEPLASGSDPLLPCRLRLLLLGRRCLGSNRVFNRGCSDRFSHASRKPYRLALVRNRLLMGGTPFRCRVRHLCVASSSWITPGRSSGGLDLHLAFLSESRPHCVHISSFSRWSSAQQALEVVCTSQCALDGGGYDFGSVLFWADRCRPSSYPKPARNRGFAERLQATTSSVHDCSRSSGSNFTVDAVVACKRDRAPADQVVCLRYIGRD